MIVIVKNTSCISFGNCTVQYQQTYPRPSKSTFSNQNVGVTKEVLSNLTSPAKFLFIICISRQQEHAQQVCTVRIFVFNFPQKAQPFDSSFVTTPPPHHLRLGYHKQCTILNELREGEGWGVGAPRMRTKGKIWIFAFWPYLFSPNDLDISHLALCED